MISQEPARKLSPTHIGDLVADKRNARRHNPRNIDMIANALQEVGASRSIVIDEHNNILAGNGTVEAAAQVGIERVRVVEADGNEIIAVRRSGLSTKDKKRLALYDNRTAELADWEPQILEEDKDILDLLFNDNELAYIVGDFSGFQDPKELWEGMQPMDGEATAYRALTVYIQSQEAVQELAEILQQKITDKTKMLWWPPKVKV